MSRETREKLEAALQHVKASRRDLLKHLLLGGGATALLAPMAQVVLAQDTPKKPTLTAIEKCIADKLSRPPSRLTASRSK